MAANRKGDVEVQFNWIFVLIIGAVILFFFINLAYRNKDMSNRELSLKLLQDLDLILTGQSVSVGRSNVLDLPPVPLEFTCDAITILQNSKRITDSIVFSAPEISGPRMITWTQDWRVPFRVTNFVYLSSSKTKYYLIPDGTPELQAFAERIKHDLPEELDVTLSSDPNSLIWENNPDVRFVFLDGGSGVPPVPQNFKGVDAEVTAVEIVNGPMDEGLGGTITFYRKRGVVFDTLGSVGSLGMSTIYAAIYTPDFEHYACSLRKALRRLAVVARVYAERTEAMIPQVRVDCRIFLAGTAAEELVPLADAATAAAEDPQLNLDGLRTTIDTAQENLHNRNEVAILKSCPTVY